MFGREEIIEEGVVESVSAGTAVVRVIKTGSCEECSAKLICSGDSVNNVLSAIDPFGVSKGDQVRISVPGKNLSTISTLYYGIPLLLLIAGIFIGYSIFEINKEFYSALFSLLLILLYAVIFYLYVKKRDCSSLLPRITFVKKI